MTGVWVNEGGDKVAQEELRASRSTENLTGKVRNRAWDGQKISLFGAANESVSFNLVLEAASASAANVSVSFDTLTGPGGAKIQTTRQAAGDDLFNYVGRPIEVFYVRYLQIQGVSSFGYDHYNEGQIPARFRAASHLWSDRPDHNLNYPDALVPIELVPSFTIAQGKNQSIWSDIFIAKDQLPGTYTGNVTVKENGIVTYSIPVSLTVQPFALPDTPTYTAFTYVHSGDIERRWFGQYTNWSTPNGSKLRDINDRYVQFLKRHRITTIGAESECASIYLPGANCGSPEISIEKRFDGSLFTPGRGYDGPGIGQGLSLYSYGSYGTWNRTINNEADMWRTMDPIGQYFQSKFPNVKPFIYLQDEPGFWDFSNIEYWSKWLSEDPGPGHFVKTLSTTSYSSGLQWMPHLDIPMAAVGIGECNGCPNGDNYAYTQGLVAALKVQPDHETWMYNYGRPGSGTSNTEDDGIAMRTFGWIQAKMQISHHFYWWANIDSQNVDLLAQACTWGCDSHPDGWWGQVSSNAYTNGNGVLLYPGTDNNPGHISYGVNGPLGSLRLKEWRRGLQDADYLALASRIDPAAVQAIVQQVLPKALWENPAPNGDVSATRGQVSWSSDPDVWESARAQLASIISSHCSSSPSDIGCIATPAPPVTPTPAPPVTPTPAPPVTPTPAPPVTPTPAPPVTATPAPPVTPTPAPPVTPTPAPPVTPTPAPPVTPTPAPPVTATPAPPVTPTPAPTVTPTPAPPVTPTPDPPVTPTPDPPVTPAPAPPVTPTPAPPVTPTPVAPMISLGAPSAATTRPLLFVPTAPCRVLDTRLSSGAPSFVSNEIRPIEITGGNCNVPEYARAFALNVTVVPHGPLDYLTVWPAGLEQPLVSNLNSYDGRVKANAAIVSAGSGGFVNVFSKGETDVIIDVNGYFVDPSSDASGLAFYPLTPCRVIDTRIAGSSQLGAPFMPGGSKRLFPVSSASCGLPIDAKAYSMNYTVVPHASLSWMTAWASEQPMPLASILNAPNGIVANAAITQAGPNGSILLFVHDDTDVIADVNGYFAPPGIGGLNYYPVPPCRALDSRNGIGPLQSSFAITFPNGNCGIPSSARVVGMNATVSPFGPLDYLSLWPAGTTRPLVSTLNANDGQVTSNLAIVPAPNGQICAYLTNSSHLLLDVFGFFQ